MIFIPQFGKKKKEEEENNEEEIRYYTPEMRSYTSFMDRQAKYSE